MIMKRLFTLALVLLFAVSMSAQQFTRVPLTKQQERGLMQGKVFPVKKVTKTSPKTNFFLNENFDAGIPSTWTITDGGSDGKTWAGVTDYNGNTLDGTPFAMVNSDAAGNVDMDEILESPAVDVSSATSLFISFDQYYNSYSGNEITDVDVWDGTAWQNVYTAGSADVGSWGNPDHQDIDVSAYINAGFKVRFHYYNANWDWYWAIDNVEIYEPQANDLAVAAETPTWGETGADVVPNVTVTNAGTDSQDDFDVLVSIVDTTNNDTIYKSTLNVTGAALAARKDTTFVMPDTLKNVAEGSYTMTAIVTLAGDEDNTNDTLSQELPVFTITTLSANTTTGNYVNINLSDASEIAIDTLASNTNFPMAEEYNGDNIYRVYNDMTFGTVNRHNGSFTSLGTLTGFSGTPTGLAWDWKDSVMYAMVLDGNNASHLCTLNLSTLTLTDIASNPAGMIIGMDFVNDSLIYGPGLNDTLYKININTGTFTEVGPVGMDLNFGQDVSFDYDSSRLYTVTEGDAEVLGYYDLTTGVFDSLAPATGQHATLVSLSKPAPYTITFNVDMTAPIADSTFDPATDTLYITGSFFNWAVPGKLADKQTMTDANSDSIYTVVVGVDSLGHYEYKYFKNSGWSNGEWDGTNNRTLDITSDTVVNDVWGQISAIKALNNVEVTVAPNPVENVVRISANANYNVVVYNIEGKAVATTQMRNNVTELDFSNFQSGVYIIKVYNNTASGTYKLIKK